MNGVLAEQESLVRRTLSKSDRKILRLSRKRLLNWLRDGGTEPSWARYPKATKYYRKYLDKTVTYVIVQQGLYYSWDNVITNQAVWSAKATSWDRRRNAAGVAALYKDAEVVELVKYRFRRGA